MNVLVIPEDFTKDQYMLKPIVEAMLKKLGKKKAKVKVCRDPLLGSVEQATKVERIVPIVNRYAGMTDLFLLCVDRDGREGRKLQLEKIEREAAAILNNFTGDRAFFAENAWQEIEVWVLAGLPDFTKARDWQEVRQERDPKERYFLPYSQQRGFANSSDEGRIALSQEAATQYNNRIRKLCTEDIQNLETRIGDWMTNLG